jgi:zinc protease
VRRASSLRPAPTTPRPYHFPAFSRQQLSNGLTVWVVPLPERQLVNVHLLFDAGAAAEAEERAGVAALTAHLLVTGTRSLDAAAFAEATERLGIEVSSESGWDSTRAAFQALPEFFDDGLALLAEMVRDPRFDPAEFERLKAERLAEIMQSRAEPGRLADEMFLRTLYTERSPYRRPSAGTPQSVSAITPEDVRAHHGRHVLPGTAHLIVAGAIGPERAVRAAEQRLGDWSGAGPGHREVTAEPMGGRRVALVDRPGSVQSELRVGLPGISRSDPRYFSASVMAAMLGGVFNSRLQHRLREELGYTYGAHAWLDVRRAAGPFTARSAVETDVTAPALTELLAQLDRVRAEDASEGELREVKDFLIGVFPLRFETTGGIAAAIEPLAVYGMPDDYWQTYRANLEAVTVAQVRAAAEEILLHDQLLSLVVGDASRVRGSLEATGIGPLQLVDVA